MYSFSTCWNSHRHTDGRAMLREIRQLGFEYAELSHGIRLGLVPGILEAVDAGEIKISSVHNFCPLPMGVNHAAPNLYEFSDERQRDRELAEHYTLKTIEFAARVKARVVVLHSGRIELKDYTDKLLAMAAKGEKNTPRFAKLSREAAEKREKKKAPFLDRLKRSLSLVLPIAESRGIKLGIENRQSLEELPFESDFPFLFRELVSPSLVYWHDTGHAQIKENLGFLEHALFLQANSERLAGFHLHDVHFPGADHFPPGSGCVDFRSLKTFIRPDHIKVFELSPAVSADEAKKGVRYLKEIFGAK